MATQYDPTTFGYQNFYSGLLTADITAGSLTINLDTVPSPTAGILVIDPDSATNREVILYTSKGASTITCPSDGRGWGGSTATSHLTGTTVIMTDVAQYFQGLSDGTLSTDPLRTALFFDHVVSGGVIAQSAGLVGTFSNIVFYLNGRRYSGTSIANKTYTASKDTYVDITGNSDGSVTVTYTEVANNAASPALATNNIRLAIVVTNGSAITSVNQGAESASAPVASSRVYMSTDSIGNLICPRDPLRNVLGHQAYTGGNLQTTSTSFSAFSGLTCPVIVPNNGRRVKFTITGSAINTSAQAVWSIGLFEDGTIIQQWYRNQDTTTANNIPLNLTFRKTPTSGSHTYTVQALTSAGTLTISAGTVTSSQFIPGAVSLTVEQD